MWKLVWLDSAVEDLFRLRDFLAKENNAVSKRVASLIKESVNRLSEFPLVGRPVADLPDYRDLLIRFGAGGYVVRYRVYADSVYIVHMRHYRENSF